MVEISRSRVIIPDERGDLEQFAVSHGDGLRVVINTLGLTIERLEVKDRWGRYQNICLQLPSTRDYFSNPQYVGCVVGRVANRIASARYSLQGCAYVLSANEGSAHLHGGVGGLSQTIWNFVREREIAGGLELEFSCVSKALADGYPGNVTLRCTVAILEGSLLFDFCGETDEPTPLSITHHGYFNLSGSFADLRGHCFRIASRRVQATSPGIPTDDIGIDISGSCLDFSVGWRHFRENDLAADPLLAPFQGLDHCYLFGGEYSPALEVASDSPPIRATLSCKTSGISMELCATAPAMQVYTGNFLDKLQGMETFLSRYAAVCLEPQLPVNFPNFSNVSDYITLPGQPYRSSIHYRFSSNFDPLAL